MKEKMWAINRNPENCEPCVMLDGGVQNWRRCKRIDEPIAQINNCEMGRLLSFPKDLAEMGNLLDLVKKDWQKKGKL